AVEKSAEAGKTLTSDASHRTWSGAACGSSRPACRARRDDMVAHTRKVLHAAAADHDHGVLLKVVAFARNVADHLEAVDEADLRNLAQSRVGLLRRRRVDARATAPLLRVGLHGRNLVALHRRGARLADQLVDGRHQTFLLSQNPCLKPCSGPFRRYFHTAIRAPNRL